METFKSIAALKAQFPNAQEIGSNPLNDLPIGEAELTATGNLNVVERKSDGAQFILVECETEAGETVNVAGAVKFAVKGSLLLVNVTFSDEAKGYKRAMITEVLEEEVEAVKPKRKTAKA